MIFFRFVLACRRYEFTYALNTYGGAILILRPNNTFDNIKIEWKYSYHKLFKEAIIEMKKYRSKKR